MADHAPVIQRYWYSIDWEVEDLWALDLPVEEVPISALEWHLDVPVWPDADGNPYRATPRQVLDNPEENHVEHARVLRADLSFPVEVLDRDGRLMILDGIHRLCRAVLEGRSHMAVRRAPPEMIKWHMPDDPELGPPS